MVTTCIVPCCRKRSDKCPLLRYFRIPAVRLNEGDVTRELTDRRRATWIARINRANFYPTAAHRVCSQHFVKGEPSQLYDRTNPDWAPSLKLGVTLEATSHTDKEVEVESGPAQSNQGDHELPSRHKDNKPTEANLKSVDSLSQSLVCASESSSVDSFGSNGDGTEESSEHVPQTEVHVRLVDCRDQLGPNGIYIIKGEEGDGSNSQIGPRGDDPAAPQEGARNRRSLRSYECSACGKLFLRLRVATHAAEKPHRCSQCAKRFTPPPPNFRKPERAASSRVRPHRCSQCDASFTQLSNLKRHELQHTGELSHVCATCGKAFGRQDLLRKHRRLHTRERPYSCTRCPKSFSWASSLRHHLTTHADQTSRNLPGNSCSAENHQSTPAEVKPYQCSQCDKTFCRKADLRVHLKRHSGERRYLCQYCGKTYSDPQSLTIHQRAHTGERPFECSWCGKRFARSSALRSHETQHTGKRPHVCEACGRAFARRDLLRKHQRTHTGEKPYHCSICGKHFGYLASLKKHQKDMHTVMERGGQRCSRCGKRFATAQDLRTHGCTTKKQQHSVEDVFSGALQDFAKELVLPLI
ncbi:zinc finger protein 70-like [Sardina pilchardus]|uniref:zinc finger protein 70-like n=1 Tax=Sardina pilchardus TaxID=27697 RepID=UPI002E150727